MTCGSRWARCRSWPMRMASRTRSPAPSPPPVAADAASVRQRLGEHPLGPIALIAAEQRDALRQRREEGEGAGAVALHRPEIAAGAPGEGSAPDVSCPVSRDGELAMMELGDVPAAATMGTEPSRAAPPARDTMRAAEGVDVVARIDRRQLKDALLDHALGRVSANQRLADAAARALRAASPEAVMLLRFFAASRRSAVSGAVSGRVPPPGRGLVRRDPPEPEATEAWRKVLRQRAYDAEAFMPPAIARRVARVRHGRRAVVLALAGGRAWIVVRPLEGRIDIVGSVEEVGAAALVAAAARHGWHSIEARGAPGFRAEVASAAQAHEPPLVVGDESYPADRVKPHLPKAAEPEPVDGADWLAALLGDQPAAVPPWYEDDD